MSGPGRRGGRVEVMRRRRKGRGERRVLACRVGRAQEKRAERPEWGAAQQKVESSQKRRDAAAHHLPATSCDVLLVLHEGRKQPKPGQQSSGRGGKRVATRCVGSLN